MCDGMKLIKDMQRKAVPLRCTVDHSCWCTKVHARFTHDNDQCLSPQELLNAHSALLSDRDLIYLRSLSCREFICE